MTTSQDRWASVFCVALSVILTSPFMSAGEVPRNTPIQRADGTPSVLPFNANRVIAYYWDDGRQEYGPTSSIPGSTYPKGTAGVISAAGVVWCGKFFDGRNPLLRASGQTYTDLLRPGAILGIRTGITEDTGAGIRIFRIRSDFRRADLKQDAADTYLKPLSAVTNADAARLKSDYARDWREWPWQKGAPFNDNGYLGPDGVTIIGAHNGTLDWGEDVNMNGFLDPGEDVNGNGVLDGETPGIAGADQVLWYDCNDVQSFSQRSGMEMQVTIWGYNRNDALGNVIFKRYRFLYKGLAVSSPDAHIDSLYIALFSDIDIGDYSNDFAGCDTALSVGFIYNSGPDRLFTNFGIAPPAVGNDFVQGPMVRGVAGQDRNRNGIDDAADYAIVNFTRVGPGFINLPLTAFVYEDRYIPRNASRYQLPGLGSTSSTIRWFQTVRGLPPSPAGPPDPDPLHNPITGQPSPLWSSGDPVTGLGWLDDGSPNLSGERIIASSSGPFTMSLGDTQEVVVAVVCGLGNNSLSSVKVMKFNDRMAQLAYNNFFNLPKSPSPPPLRITALHGQLLLEWESDSAAVAATENVVLPGNYSFEGYNVYQMPSSDAGLASARLIARYDVVDGIRTILEDVFDEASGEILSKPVQNGTDSGIRRSLLVSRDSIMQRPLVDGQTYYFAVTAYNYTPDVTNPVRSVESVPQVVPAIPETPRPGTRFPYIIGDTVQVSNVVGDNDAVILPVVYNPAIQTGDVYHLSFDTSATGAILWGVNNSRTGRIIFSGISNLRGDTPYRVVDGGFDVFVSAPPTGIRTIVDTLGNNVFGTESTNPSYAIFSVYRQENLLDGGLRNQRDYEIRFDGRGSYALEVRVLAGQSQVVRVPFSLWDVGRKAGDPQFQVIGSYKDSNSTPGRWNVTQTGVYYDTTLYKVFEPIYMTSIPYPSANDSAGILSLLTPVFNAAQNRTNQNSAIFGVLIADKDHDNLPPPVGTRIKFTKWHRIEQGDVKAILPVRPTVGDVALARADVSLIKVFPNPIYGTSTTPTGVTRKSMTFSHLPDRAIIRIFNLSGVLVRVIVKDDQPNGSQFSTWDLQNQSGLPVASGLYLAYIEMPDLSVTKVLKLVVIQEEEYRRSY